MVKKKNKEKDVNELFEFTGIGNGLSKKSLWLVIIILSVLCSALIGNMFYNEGLKDGYNEAEKDLLPQEPQVLDDWNKTLRVSAFVLSIGLALGLALHGVAIIRV